MLFGFFMPFQQISLIYALFSLNFWVSAGPQSTFQESSLIEFVSSGSLTIKKPQMSSIEVPRSDRDPGGFLATVDIG
jgi:hypothetical protein